MAYQVKRSKKISERLELLNSDGSLAMTIDVNLDADSIAKRIRIKQVALLDAQKNLTLIQKTKNEIEFEKALEMYGRAVVDLFETVFGRENTASILAYYENNYIEAITQLVPFISEVIMPSVKQALTEQKKQLKSKYKNKYVRSWWQ